MARPQPGLVGAIGEYDSETETIAPYLERLHMYLTANGIEEDKKVSVLLTVIGAKTYGLLRSLFSPVLPQEKTYEELVARLKSHFSPDPVVTFERYQFYGRKQRDGEPVAEFLAELRRLSVTCKFGAFLEEALKDALVFNIHSQAVQRRLFAERNLTLDRALEIAQGMEAAEKSAREVKGYQPPSTSVLKVASAGGQPQLCYRCGAGHNSRECRFRDSKCNNCNKTGHIAKVCKSAKRGYQRRPFNRTNRVEESELGSSSKQSSPVEDDVDMAMFCVRNKKGSPPIQVQIKVQGKPLSMEVDTSR